MPIRSPSLAGAPLIMQSASAAINTPRSSANGIASVANIPNGSTTTIASHFNASALAQLQAQQALAAMQYGALGAAGAGAASFQLPNGAAATNQQNTIADYQQLLLKYFFL